MGFQYIVNVCRNTGIVCSRRLRISDNLEFNDRSYGTQNNQSSDALRADLALYIVPNFLNHVVLVYGRKRK